jgi:uncharacterized protein (DUF58 family)
MAAARPQPQASRDEPGLTWFERGWRWLDRRLPNLTRRHRFESLPIRLNRHRIYIVPSSFGFFFALMMFAILLGALNYNNNGALLYGLLSVSLAVISMLQTFRNLDQLSLVQVTADPVFAGEPVHFEWHLKPDDPRARFGISLLYQSERRHLDIPDAATTIARFAVPTTQRGWLVPDPIRVSTVWPFGLFFAWSYLHSNVRVLVYPRPESPPAPMPRAPEQNRRSGADSGDDDLRSLREYVPGDATRLIAWKASARTGDLLVRQMEIPRSRETVFDFERIAGLSLEAKLSRLTRWVIEAEHVGMHYTLRLPGSSIGPDTGHAHRQRCLTQLATHALPSP